MTKISTKDSIVSTSIKLFHERGFQSTTLQEISKGAKASIGSIYHAFPKGKDDIATTIISQYSIESQLRIASTLKLDIIDMSLQVGIEAIINVLLDIGNTYPCIYDSSFDDYRHRIKKHKNDLEQDMHNYSAFIIKLKNPSLSKQDALLKATVCNTLWDSLFTQYFKHKDIRLIEEIKIITTNYLKNLN
jgi:AcrR family transcriptional regulator